MPCGNRICPAVWMVTEEVPAGTSENDTGSPECFTTDCRNALNHHSLKGSCGPDPSHGQYAHSIADFSDSWFLLFFRAATAAVETDATAGRRPGQSSEAPASQRALLQPCRGAHQSDPGQIDSAQDMRCGN